VIRARWPNARGIKAGGMAAVARRTAGRRAAAQGNQTAQTKSTPVTRKGGRIAFKLPFDPPSVIIEGDKTTAMAEGIFVDYWERIR
jgi:hypothetical protein